MNVADENCRKHENSKGIHVREVRRDVACTILDRIGYKPLKNYNNSNGTAYNDNVRSRGTVFDRIVLSNVVYQTAVSSNVVGDKRERLQHNNIGYYRILNNVIANHLCVVDNARTVLCVKTIDSTARSDFMVKFLRAIERRMSVFANEPLLYYCAVSFE